VSVALKKRHLKAFPGDEAAASFISPHWRNQEGSLGKPSVCENRGIMQGYAGAL
jgi:hypothetical protein